AERSSHQWSSAAVRGRAARLPKDSARLSNAAPAPVLVTARASHARVDASTGRSRSCRWATRSTKPTTSSSVRTRATPRKRSRSGAPSRSTCAGSRSQSATRPLGAMRPSRMPITSGDSHSSCTMLTMPSVIFARRPGLVIHLRSTIDNGGAQRDGRRMRVGMVLRNMGPQSTRETVLACARAADAAPAIADVWVTDHIAIPPDDAEGSDGRYLDPLGSLAFLAGVVVEANGQPFLFRPRPPRPPIFIGGAPPRAFRRAVAHRAGWMPMGLGPEQLAPLATELRARAADAGLDAPPVAILTTLPLADATAARDRLA